MNAADALQRAWFILYFGLFLLAGVGVQLWTGHTLIRLRGIVSKKKNPKTYWFGVISWGALALFFIGLPLARIL